MESMPAINEICFTFLKQRIANCICSVHRRVNGHKIETKYFPLLGVNPM